MTDRTASVVPLPIKITIATIQTDHIVQRQLCDDLEGVADRLPTLPNLPELRDIVDLILCVTTMHFARAEQVLRILPVEQRQTPAILDALHEMHLLDELHGDDLIIALSQHVSATTSKNIEQLAYMLRCFFDGCRRAIRLKESYLGRSGDGAVRPD